MRDVYVADNCFGGINHYVVMVDGKPYDEFTAKWPLTNSDMIDVADYYTEGLGR